MKRLVAHLSSGPKPQIRQQPSAAAICARLVQAPDQQGKKAVLDEHAHSVGKLAEISALMSDEELAGCSRAVCERLKGLEVGYHFGHLTRGSDSKEDRCRALVQQHTYGLEVADRPIISDTANYMEAHLTDAFTNPGCADLLARLSKTSPEDLKLASHEYVKLLDEGMINRIKAAKKQSPEALEKEKLSVSKDIEAKLSPEKLKGMKFVQLTAKTVNAELIGRMMEPLGQEDRLALRDALVEQLVKDLESGKFGKDGMKSEKFRGKVKKDGMLLARLSVNGASTGPRHIAPAIKELYAEVRAVMAEKN
ncbi:MAG: hypothetical protein ACR2PT_08620 [Endozoicomonas sp.]